MRPVDFKANNVDVFRALKRDGMHGERGFAPLSP